jgi:hypothetical protein
MPMPKPNSMVDYRRDALENPHSYQYNRMIEKNNRRGQFAGTDGNLATEQERTIGGPDVYSDVTGTSSITSPTTVSSSRYSSFHDEQPTTSTTIYDIGNSHQNRCISEAMNQNGRPASSCAPSTSFMGALNIPPSNLNEDIGSHSAFNHPIQSSSVDYMSALPLILSPITPEASSSSSNFQFGQQRLYRSTTNVSESGTSEISVGREQTPSTALNQPGKTSSYQITFSCNELNTVCTFQILRTQL